MRLRFKYSKTGDAAFLGHLEMLRFWQRAMRRAQLPLAYSGGFNPRPRIAFGPALAVGVESQAEYLDIELIKKVVPKEVKMGLKAQLPDGIDLLLAVPIPDGTPALTASMEAAAYQISFLGSSDRHLLWGMIKKILACRTIPIRWQGKKNIRTKDIRPGILKLEVVSKDTLEMLLESSPRGNVRPEQVLRAMNCKIPFRILRTGLYIRWNGFLLTPEEVAQGGEGRV